MEARQLLFTLCFLSVFPLASQAQRFNGGAFFGLNTSQISGDELAGFDKAGLYLGAFANLSGESKPGGWQIEVGYLEKGSRKLPHPDKGDFYSYRLRLNYVETYISYQYFWRTYLWFEAGPSLGVLVRSSEQVNEGGSASRLDNGEFFDRYDLSLNIGANYRLSETWSLGVRFANSIIPVRPHASGASYILNFGQYNEILSFSFRYQFGPAKAIGETKPSASS
jgi:hypothetical protein